MNMEGMEGLYDDRKYSRQRNGKKGNKHRERSLAEPTESS